jgi:hypothetical protein
MATPGLADALIRTYHDYVIAHRLAVVISLHGIPLLCQTCSGGRITLCETFAQNIAIYSSRWWIDLVVMQSPHKNRNVSQVRPDDMQCATAGITSHRWRKITITLTQ